MNSRSRRRIGGRWDGAIAGLYPIVDLDACERHAVTPLDLARAVLTGGAKLLQLRAKRTPAENLYPLLNELKKLTRTAGAALIVNDRADLASLIGADGVHVGQDDMAVRDVRQIDSNLWIGVSTHSLEQLERALLEKPTYVAFGPIFDTSSKQRAETSVGLDALQHAHALAIAAQVPLVAIGGISGQRVAQVAPYADAVAVISALFEHGSDTEKLRANSVELFQALATASR